MMVTYFRFGLNALKGLRKHVPAAAEKQKNLKCLMTQRLRARNIKDVSAIPKRARAARRREVKSQRQKMRLGKNDSEIKPDI